MLGLDWCEADPVDCSLEVVGRPPTASSSEPTLAADMSNLLSVEPLPSVHSP